MRCSWMLVVVFAISGFSRAYGIDTAKNYDLDQVEAKVQSKYSRNAEVLTEEQFNCHNKPSGYYADPRFNCKVFHFCHEDGTRVTIPCSQSSSKHRVCLFKDIISNACEDSEIYLALPEDQSQIKSSKDTTASAFNDATEFKLPRVLSQPSSSTKKQSTTPLSFGEHKNEKTNSLLTQGVDGIYEVFNSVQKETESEEKSQLESKDSNVLKLSPSTFSRGSRVHASLEKRNGLLNAFPSLERRSDENGAYLVEVYNKDIGNADENDYSSYRRKSKKLFFASNSDKKTPAKHPRRRRRMVIEPLNVRRPYAVIYTKFPDFTFASDTRTPRKLPRQRQDALDLPFAPAIVPADTPTIPITIETRRKKKSKSKKKPKPSSDPAETVPADPLQGQEETAEQQNILFYTPNQGPPIRQPNSERILAPNGQNRNPENQRSPVRERPRQSSFQQAARPQIDSQSNTRAPYAPPQGNPLQLPTFPFQPQFLNNAPQTSYYFGPQDFLQNGGFPPFGPPINLPEQAQGQPQQNNNPVRYQTQPDPNSNLSQYQPPPPLPNNSPSYPGQQQTRHNPPQQPTQSQTPQRQPQTLENTDNGRPATNSDRSPDHTRGRQQRPRIPIPGFNNVFLEGFPGFDALAFNGPFAQHEGNVFNIPPISQPELPPPQPQQPQVPRQRQPPRANEDRPAEAPQTDNQQRRPIQTSNRPPINSLPTSYSLQANGDPNQFVREILERERTRNENPEILVPVRPSQRPPRTRGRPSPPSEQPVSRRPERQRDRVRPNQSDDQVAKDPAEIKPLNRSPHISEQNQAPRRPQNDSPYIPPELVIQPEVGPNVPLRNVISNEYVPNVPGHPYALTHDLTYQNQPISENVQNRPLEIVYSQREPHQRLRPQVSTQSERERRPTEPQIYSTHNYPPTTFSPPSQRTRNPDRYPPRTTYTSRLRATEEPTRNIEERPVHRYRTTPAAREGSSYIRTRPSSTRQQYPEESPVTSRYYANSSPRYRPSVSSDDSPNQVHSRYPEQVQRPRSRPQAQIERPPSEYTDNQPVVERPTYPRPQDSFSYPPQGNPNYNDVNVISTIDDSGERYGTQQPAVRRPGYSGTASNSRYPHRNSDSAVQNGFLPLTEAPVRENSYLSRDPTNDHRDQEYQRPRNGKPYRNRYQDFDDEITSTREVTTTTTSRPTTKRRPPPPRPTFPAFPTFPPPPKRPVTSPKPRTTSEPTELKEEIREPPRHSAESDVNSKSTEGRAPYVETYNSPESSKSKEVITDKYSYTEEPEVTTRRRTRKRRPKQRRPKPSTSPPEEDISYIDLSTSAPVEKETSTKSASERYNVRKVTPQPRRTTSTTTAAEIQASASSVKNEEYGSRINLFGKPRTRKPAVFQNKFTTTAAPSKQEPQRYTKVTTSTRTRRPYTRRTRPKSTTTTTEPNDVTEPMAHHDEDADASNLSWRDATDMVPLQESESITQVSVDTVPDDILATEPYNELVETTEVPDTTTIKTFGENESSTENKDKVDNFESTRSNLKKFQNRPRVLKFGKPKLRTTEPPLDLNVAASVRRV